MSQPEARLQRKIQDAVRAAGHFCFKVHGSEFMMSGLPDIIVCARGHFIGLEVKLPSTREDVSRVQRLVHTKIEHAGGVARVVCSAQEALDAIEAALSGE